MRIITSGFIILICICNVFGQQSPMTLKNCIEYGLKNHRSNFISANDILATQAKIQEVRSAYLPSVNINGSVDNNLKVQESVIPGALFGSTEDVRVAFTKKYNTLFTAQLDQTIYDQSLITSFKANQYSKQEAQLNKEYNEEAIIYNVSTAYYQVFVNRQKVEFLLEDLETYKQQLAIAKLQVDKGVLLEVDMNKIQVSYNNTLSQLHVAESNLTLFENELKNAMGLLLTDSILLDTTTQITETAVLSSQVNPKDFSVSTRKDYQLSMVNISMLEIEENRIKATALPKLTGYARYGGNGFGDDLSGSFSTISDFSAVGLKLNIPVFNGLKRNGQSRQARYSRLNAIENLNLDKEKYLLEYENVRTQLIQALSSMENDERTLKLSQSVFQATDLQYQKGITDLTDWLLTQRSLKEAQANYLNSLFKFYLSLVDLEKAKGTLKNFYNAL